MEFAGKLLAILGTIAFLAILAAVALSPNLEQEFRDLFGRDD